MNKFDVVLLDSNPFNGIGHTKRIHAVIANGRTFDRPALDGMLAEMGKGSQQRP